MPGATGATAKPSPATSAPIEASTSASAMSPETATRRRCPRPESRRAPVSELLMRSCIARRLRASTAPVLPPIATVPPRSMLNESVAAARLRPSVKRRGAQVRRR